REHVRDRFGSGRIGVPRAVHDGQDVVSFGAQPGDEVAPEEARGAAHDNSGRAHETMRGSGSGTMNLPRNPPARSFGISSSAMCHEKRSRYSGGSSLSTCSSTTGMSVPGKHFPIL